MEKDMDTDQVLREFAAFQARPRLLLGLIGDDIQRSPSPFLYATEGQARGLDLDFRLIDTRALGLSGADMPRLLDAVTLSGFRGLTITHPHKEAMAELMPRLSDDARRIGSINQMVFEGGVWTGHNTDWVGFMRSFREKLDGVPLDSVILVGAGGAAKAVAYAMLRHGVKKLLVFDLDEARAEALVVGLNAQFGGKRAISVAGLEDAVSGADGLVNASPVGMNGRPGMPVDAGLLRPDLWVADIALARGGTELLRRARAAGSRTLDGVGMVVYQAVEAFGLFTGLSPDADRMMRRARVILDTAD